MTSLITGASSGIGLELARVFAEHRHDVVLVARSETRLQTLAAELQAKGVRTHVIVSDLSAHGGAALVAQRAADLGLAIDVLVNNAGHGTYGPFLQTPWETEASILQVNIVALTELTKRLLPPMVARKNGRILNVASTAAFLPGPLMAVYYASKAYVLSFSEAIANELEGTGVTVTVLAPGPTASGFQAAAALEESKLVAGRKLPTARDVAHAAYDGLMAGKPLVVPGLVNKLTIQLPRFTPRRMVASIVRNVQERRR